MRVFAIAALVNGTVALLGPIIGVAMMFVTPASLGVINFVSSLVYVFVLPAAGIAITLLFYDLRIRKAGLRTSQATTRRPDQRSATAGDTAPSTAPQGT